MPAPSGTSPRWRPGSRCSSGEKLMCRPRSPASARCGGTTGHAGGAAPAALPGRAPREQRIVSVIARAQARSRRRSPGVRRTGRSRGSAGIQQVGVPQVPGVCVRVQRLEAAVGAVHRGAAGPRRGGRPVSRGRTGYDGSACAMRLIFCASAAADGYECSTAGGGLRQRLVGWRSRCEVPTRWTRR